MRRLFRDRMRRRTECDVTRGNFFDMLSGLSEDALVTVKVEVRKWRRPVVWDVVVRTSERPSLAWLCVRRSAVDAVYAATRYRRWAAEAASSKEGRV